MSHIFGGLTIRMVLYCEVFILMTTITKISKEIERKEEILLLFRYCIENPIKVVKSVKMVASWCYAID